MPEQKNRLSRLIDLAACIALPLFTGFIGSIFVAPRLDNWYAALDKPFFTPPNWLFGPAWTLLYILIGASLYLIYVSEHSEQRGRAFFAFTVQLILNTLWSILFFGLESPLAGLLIILTLIIAIGWTMLEYYRLRPLAACLLVPYMMWVCYAAALNLAIVILN